MALTPNDVLRISEPVEQMYMDCASQLLINLCRHFSTDKALETRAWETKKLSELGALTQESIEIIAATTGKATATIKSAIAEGMGIELEDVEKVLNGAANAGKIQGIGVSWQASESVRTVVKTLTEQATDDANIVNTVMLQSTRERYVNAVQFAATEELALIEELQSAASLQKLQSQLNATQRALNATTLSTAVGAEARTTAVRRAIKQLAEQGITGYIDAGGHKWSPEAYINMDIRTTIHNAAVQGQKARAADYGVSTFQISTKAAARPLCAPYQGWICSWDNSSGTVYDLNGKAYQVHPIRSTSYGEPAGIFGINCGHSPQTFVDGYSLARYDELTPEQAKANEEAYQLSQKQRSLERKVRSAKTEALAYDAAGDKEAFAKAATKVKEANAQYTQFCKANNLPKRVDRTQVFGYNRSVSSKANWAAKREEEFASFAANIRISLPKRNSAEQYKQYVQKVASGKVDLGPQDKAILEALPKRYMWTQVKAKDASIYSLAALTAKTGDEFAMFAKGDVKIIVRGNKGGWTISKDLLRKIYDEQLRWTGHSHPTTVNLEASADDRRTLEQFKWQKKSTVVDLNGNTVEFTKNILQDMLRKR